MSHSFCRGTGVSLSEKVVFLFSMRVGKNVTGFPKYHSGSAATPSHCSGSFRSVQPRGGTRALLMSPAQDFISSRAT